MWHEEVTLLVDSSERTIAILGDRLWPQTAQEEGHTLSYLFLCNIWKKRTERPNVGGVSIRSRNDVSSRKVRGVNSQKTTASSN